jgi:predicted dehydrogenase
MFMKFALLGCDPLALALARAAVSLGHDLVWIGESPGAREELHRVSPQAEWDSPWELLVDGSVANAVIVGLSGDEEKRVEQLRRMAQAGTHLLVSHPVTLSVPVHYELEMIRETSRAVLHHYVPGAAHPAIQRLAELARADDHEKPPARQLIFERPMANRSQQAVLEQFARDATLISLVCGQPRKIGALGAPDDRAAYAALSVQMWAESGVRVSWSVRPHDPSRQPSMELVSEERRAVLSMPDAQQAWVLDEFGGDTPGQKLFADWDDSAAAIQQWVAAIGARGRDSNWMIATRSVEMAEAIPQSLRRGRSVELNSQHHSEATAFKGTMAATGCGLLLAVFALALVVGIGDAVHPMTGRSITRYWSAAVLVALVVFLLLQLLFRLVPRSREPQEMSSASFFQHR